MRLISGAFLLKHSEEMSDVTRILSQIESGDPSAAEQLVPLVQEELRKLAAAMVWSKGEQVRLKLHFAWQKRGANCLLPPKPPTP